MVQLTLLCVGKLKERFYLDACREYEKRLGGHCRISVVELSEERLPEAPSPAQIDAALSREAEAIKGKLPKGALLAALCVEGELLSSEELATRMEQWMLTGASHLVFVIGGSHGLHASIKNQAVLRLSLSPMTFPHHLARVIVLEQLYRAFQISKGTRYHK